MARVGAQTAMNRWMWTAFAIVTLALVPACKRAPENAAPSENPRDLGGVWQAIEPNDISENLLPGEEISFTAYGAQRYKTIDHMHDPSNDCRPLGFFRGLQTMFAPFQIVQSPDVTMIGMEFGYQFRLIYTDGRKHPDDIYDYLEWMGHSVGRWEGDTFVVDAIGFNEGTWLDTPGLEHSAKLHSIERFQKIAPNRIKWTVTIEDPVFFTKPFTYAREFERQDTRIMSFSCTENEKDFAYMRPLIGGTHRNKKALIFPK
jgi:hypothetical protein